MGRWTVMVVTASMFFATLVVTGCGGSKNGAVRVAGSVTYNGAAIEVGEIRFVPTGAGASGTFTSPIKGGDYEVSGDQSLLPGDYRVEVRGFRNRDGSTGSIDFGDPEADYVQYVPDKYNRISELTQTIEAGSGAEVRVDLNLDK